MQGEHCVKKFLSITDIFFGKSLKVEKGFAVESISILVFMQG